jgi:hypothetical protein
MVGLVEEGPLAHPFLHTRGASEGPTDAEFSA